MSIKINKVIAPVQVRIKNLQKFSQVAMVLDNDTVLKKIYLLREKWKIESFYPYKQYIKWQQKLGEESNDMAFRKEIESLRKSLNLDPVFDILLKKATVCNEVSDHDYKSAYLIPVPNPRSKEFVYAIVINPNTSKGDLIEVFNSFRNDIQLSN